MKGFQTWIGYNDVKSTPANFYVQRKNKFSQGKTPIPFDIARLNIGGAMNLTSGIFTAPTPGRYFFSFSGIALFRVTIPPEQTKTLTGINDALYSKTHSILKLSLKLNGDQIGRGEGKTFDKVRPNSQTLALQSTLDLKKGDRIWLEIEEIENAELHDNGGWQTFSHFTGSLLQEDIF